MRTIGHWSLLFLVSSFVACGGGDSGPAAPAAVAPSITTQPGAVSTVEGQAATFTVAASGTAPLTYQWRRDGSPIAGATSSSLVIAAAQPSDAGSYTVVVSNSAGSTTSAAATLTVEGLAVVTVSGAATVGTRGAITFTAGVTGPANHAVTWSVQEAAGGSIATNGTYTAPSDAGTYHIVATSVAQPTRSGSATVTVFASGNLRIGQQGLPANVVAAIQVTGPAGFTPTTLTQADQTLSSVPVGDYTVTVPTVSSGGVTFQPAEPGATFTRTVSLNNTNLSGVSFVPQNPPADGSIVAAGTALSDHVDGAAFELPNGKVLLVGAFGTQSEEFNPATGTFQNAGSHTAGSSYEANGALMGNGKVIIAGGGVGTPTNATSIYDPTPRTWTAGPTMAVARMNHTVTTLANGKVLVAGGRGANGLLNTAELYDPATNSWSPLGNLVVAREHHAATLLANGLVLLTGGGTNSAETFDPSTGEFTAVASTMSQSRSYHRSVLLPSGKVVIAGGGATVDIFDPATNTFGTPATLNIPRSYVGVAVLPDGRVLLSGGMTNGDASASTEILNPGTGTVTFGPNLALSRQEHMSLLLSNGKVLIAGGRGLGNVARKAAEYYVP